MNDLINCVMLLIQSSTGYSVSETSLIEYLLQSEKQHIMNYCNVKEVPEGLHNALIEQVAGTFMLIKKEDILGSDKLNIVKSIREGDTTVEFGGDTPLARLTTIAEYLTRERDLVCYRKLKW